MTGREGRLDRLLPTLTIQERATEILCAWKDGRPEDPQVRRSMPSEQREGLRRLVNLVLAAHRTLGCQALILKGLVGQLELQVGWLSTLTLSALDAYQMSEFVVFHTAEPITESEHQRKISEARAELIPLADLAEILVGEDPANSEFSDREWKRRVRERSTELEGLLASGVLLAQRRGRRTRIEYGSYADWRGESVDVPPEWGVKLEVVPDEEAERVHRDREGRERVRQLVSESPLWLVRPGLGRLTEPAGGGTPTLSTIAKALLGQVKEGIAMRWQEVRAVELAATRLSNHFGGEDILHPDVRGLLDESKERILKAQANVSGHVGAVLEDPAPAAVATLVDLVTSEEVNL